MPVFSCPNGKFKIGQNGECTFNTHEAAENAFKHWVKTKNAVLITEGEYAGGYEFPDNPQWQFSTALGLAEIYHQEVEIGVTLKAKFGVDFK